MTSNGSYATGSFGTGGPATLSSFGVIAGAADRVVAEGVGFVVGLWNSIVRAIKVSRTEKMLAGLDEHMLKDIGISRSEIGAVAIHSVEYPEIPYRRRAW